MPAPKPDPAEPIADLVETDAARSLGLQRVSQMLSSPPPNPLVPGWIDRGELFLLVGRSGGGKTLCAIDLSCSVATGTAWLHQLPVRSGTVVYVVAEGRNSIAPRLRAWCKSRNVKADELEDNLFFATGLADLGADDWVRALIAVTDRLSAELVIIDTLAQASPGKDENSARDMGEVIRAAQTLLLRASRPAVGILHHHGKDQARGARGSTAIPAACDVILSLSGSARALTLVTNKQRNHDVADAITLSIHGNPPVLRPNNWTLGEIIHAGLAGLPGGLPYIDRVGMARQWARTALPPWRASDARLTNGPSREAVGKAFEVLISGPSVNLTDGVYRVNPNTKHVPGVNFTTPPADLEGGLAPPASTTSPSIDRGEVDGGQLGLDDRSDFYSNGALDEDYLADLVRLTDEVSHDR